MKSLLTAATLALGLASGHSAQAQAAPDPALEFLGYCIQQANSTNYCACMADALGTNLTGPQLAVYLDYLKLLAGGERDQARLIATLKERHGITGKQLGEILKIATDTTGSAEKTCAGL